MTDFVNAQEMNRKHPDTFWVPPDDDLAAIFPGDCVKVCAREERFWVWVTAVNGETITGRVDNDLTCTDQHGLRLGDTISFRRENVYVVEHAGLQAESDVNGSTAPLASAPNSV